MKLLVISMAGIGDTILATPLIHELRANFPDAQIDAAVLWAGSKDILQDNPWVNRVFQKNFFKCGRGEAFSFIRELRRQQYDVSINTHPQSRIHYRVISRMIGAPIRISHRYECWTPLDRFLVNRVLEQDYSRHTVDLNLDILPVLGGRQTLHDHKLELFLSPEDERFAEAFLKSKDLLSRPVLGIHTGSGGTKNLKLKRWPAKQYVALIDRLLASRPELAILLFGGSEEEAEIQSIVAPRDPRRVMRAETRSLHQAAALIRRCTSFLSVDTALMHVAAAVQAPGQVVVEAPTFNRTNEPFGNQFVLVRNPAVNGRNLDYYRYDGRAIQGTDAELIRCMESVTVPAVQEQIERLIPA
jgi:ADP-heptose:LPS heptosyltransferase